MSPGINDHLITAGIMTLLIAVIAGLVRVVTGEGGFQMFVTDDTQFEAPSQSVFIDLLDSNVLWTNGNSWEPPFFNPTNTTPPFFQIFDYSFLHVLGPNPSVRSIAENNDNFEFAHEGPVWIPQTDEVFFCSSAGAPGTSDIDHNNQVSKINIKQAKADEKAIVTTVPLAEDIQMTNGGTNFRGQLLLVNSGRGKLAPNIALVNPKPPYNSTILLDNFFGRQFNSLNDVKIHPISKKIFFTDVTYGWINHFRPPPQLPNQVYRFDPDTGSVRVVADQFVRDNGIAFTADGKTAYVTDTGLAGGNQTDPTTIYQYDVDPVTQAFKNRRVFAYADNGIPDGIQLDTRGNVYAGCGDGVHVWNPSGLLIGKIFIGSTSANMVFAGPGTMIVLAETKIFLVQFAANGQNLARL